MVDTKNYSAFAAVYPTLAAAEADYDAVKSLYYDAKLMDTFDAAVVTRRDDGKVKITAKHEQPTRHGAQVGTGVGLAAGAIIALFPGAALGALLVAGAGGGAAIGAIAGHVSGGIDRDDLKDLGKLLDEGESSLVVVAANDIEPRVAEIVSDASQVVRKDLNADWQQLRKEIEEAEREEVKTS